MAETSLRKRAQGATKDEAQPDTKDEVKVVEVRGMQSSIVSQELMNWSLNLHRQILKGSRRRRRDGNYRR